MYNLNSVSAIHKTPVVASSIATVATAVTASMYSYSVTGGGLTPLKVSGGGGGLGGGLECIWRWINSVKGFRRPLLPLQEDSLIVDDDAKATVFNQYFQSVFTAERLSDLSSVQSSTTAQSSVIDSINFTSDDVFQELINLDVSKACGPDLIPPLLLKKAAAYINLCTFV